MSRFEDETLMRRIDNELDAETALAVDEAASTSPTIAARLDALRRTGKASRLAFPAAVDPRDANLARLITATGQAKDSRSFDWRSWLTPQSVGLGAGLALAGFVAGVVLQPGASGRMAGLVDAKGRITNAELVQVLDRRLAAEGPDAEGRAVHLTFEATDGRWCRTFRDSGAAMAGLACRSSSGWSIQALSPVEAASGELRMAGSDVPAPVLAAVDLLILDETVSARDEARARDAGFR